MARVTVEDCLKNVKNRFELVLVASKRSRELMLTGKEPFVEWDNDKATVVALREIAEGHITAKILDEAHILTPEPEIVFEVNEPESKEAASHVSADDDLLMVASPEPVAPVLPLEPMVSAESE